MNLQDALKKATDELYYALNKTNDVVLITPSNTVALTEKIETEISKTDFVGGFKVQINLDDENEFVDVYAISQDETAQISLRYETTDGKIVVRVDTDGDGK